MNLSEVEKPTAAFVLSLLAGALIVIGGSMMSMMNSLWFGGMMSGLGYGFGIMSILGMAFGVVVIISAIMLNGKPKEHTTWGTLIIIFSALSIFGGAMGGLGVGLILGLIGGVLAVTWKPSGAKK